MMIGFEQLRRVNVKLAEDRWGIKLGKQQVQALNSFSEHYGFQVALGDLLLLDGKWYVTHAGLLRLATHNRCQGICVRQVREFCDPGACRWVFKATVYKTSRSKGFVGYGDADPSNVSSLVRGAEMRVAETRAVNRALRKAYGVGLCSVEELGSLPRASGGKISSRNGSHPSGKNGQENGHQNGQPRLRDRLCLLIRQHGLDANLVKAYAADYCGTATLREAGRGLVEAFINNVAEWAAKDREGLLCHLNSYAKPEEAGK
jgi:hypothetical protein